MKKDVQTKDILALAVELGITMLENGAEISRIEETIERILTAYQIERFDVYVLSNGIFASADEDTAKASSMVRHMPRYTTNLSRIADLNQLSRQICSFDLDFEAAWDCLKEIRKSEGYPGWALMLACGLGCGCFAYLFGGSALDSVIAFLLGFVEEFFILAMAKARFSRSISQVFCSTFITAITYVLTTLVPGTMFNRDKIIIGAIMVLVPGIIFTTAIRDFYNGDYLSGAIHLLDALLTALCIAAGVCIAYGFFRLIGWGVA